MTPLEPLSPGEPAPWFKAPTPSSPEFVFDSVGGRHVLMLFLPVEPVARIAALRALAGRQKLFDPGRLAAFVVVRDRETAAQAKDMRGLRWILDEDLQVSRLYQAVDAAGRPRSFWLGLDPAMRVLARAPVEAPEALIEALAAAAFADAASQGAPFAPVLLAPCVFEPELCRTLIALHQDDGGAFTGVMRDQGEVTVAVMDELKRRRDILIQDEGLRAAIAERLQRRLFPFIARAFGTEARHIERFLVSCYDARDGGVFHAHRDNTTFQTAHRKFACSINLNADFEGGDLRFPEFGPRTYRPPPGGAVVFACGLMHEARPVSAGRRYAFLPFLYDDAGAAVRAAYAAKEARAAGRAAP
jgi:hypothetical protein